MSTEFPVRPLSGIRILALEQMQSVPYATQLLGRLGADVLKIEPIGGESGRHARPAATSAAGEVNGATFLRNNLGKRSIAIDLKAPEGRDLVLRLASRFDVIAQNFKAGALDRLGLSYRDVSAVHPEIIYLSVSGFGTTTDGGYMTWPAYAPIAEAMAGLYAYQTPPGDAPPTVSPMGALGDTTTALFASIGILAALRQRDQAGVGQHIDLAMLDALVAMNDAGINYWSMGVRNGIPPIINHSFRARDGWFVVQVGRRHMFEGLAKLLGSIEWIDDPDLQEGAQWLEHIEDRIRPVVERWSADMDRDEACRQLAAAGVAAGPVRTAGDVIDDPHVKHRNMVLAVETDDGRAEPVLAVGLPIKLSSMREELATSVPSLGQDTDDVLSTDLGLDAQEIRRLRAADVVA